MITDILLNDSVVPLYEKLEISFQLTEPYDNPFDERDVEVWGVFTGPAPTHMETSVPGYFDQQFEIVEIDDQQELKKKGDPNWKIRFAPVEVGKWHLEINVRYQEQPPVSSGRVDFECKGQAENSKGFVRRSGKYHLCHDDGSTYLPVGYNLAWDDPKNKKIVDWYVKRLQKASLAKTNWTRLWMSTWGNFGLAIEWSPLSYGPAYEGVGSYSLESAWKLDRIVNLMQYHGIAAQLVLELHVNWQRDQEWPANPYNMCIDGGFLGEPEEFFSDGEARRLFKQRLRYIVARWSYSTSILAWELFNEVQNIDGFKDCADHVIQWHHEMADYLRAIDPAKHLITTSSHVPAIETIWSIDTIDLIQPHLYSSSMIDAIEETCKSLMEYDKPVIIGEFGTLVCDVQFPEDNLGKVPDRLKVQLEEGLHLHNGMWSATFQRASAMLWWWNYIDQQQLYEEFAPLRTFWEDEILDDELKPASIDLTNVPTRTHLWIAPGLLDYFDQAAQTSFRVDTDGSIAGQENLHPFLHGNAQQALKTDPVFLIDLEGGELTIHWNKVAQRGAIIDVLVDDKKIKTIELERDQKCGSESIAMPAGHHRVQVRNSGADWVVIKFYEFTGCSHHAVKVYGLTRLNRAYLWFTDVANQLHRETASAPVEQLSASLHGLQDGAYLMQLYNTKLGGGGVIQENTVECREGTLAFELPSFTRDIAVKFKIQKMTY